MVIHFKGVEGSGEKAFFEYYDHFIRLDDFIECDEEIENSLAEIKKYKKIYGDNDRITHITQGNIRSHQIASTFTSTYSNRMITNYDNVDLQRKSRGGRKQPGDIYHHYPALVVEIINTRKRSKKRISNSEIKSDYSFSFNGNRIELFKEMIKFDAYLSERVAKRRERKSIAYTKPSSHFEGGILQTEPLPIASVEDDTETVANPIHTGTPGSPFTASAVYQEYVQAISAQIQENTASLLTL